MKEGKLTYGIEPKGLTVLLVDDATGKTISQSFTEDERDQFIYNSAFRNSQMDSAVKAIHLVVEFEST